MLRKWKQANGVPPQRIFFYRDGVANNMFNNECNAEIGCIDDIAIQFMTQEAASEEGGASYRPEIIYIVVQQRTKARFATTDRKQVPCGTVVDQDIGSIPPKDAQGP